MKRCTAIKAAIGSIGLAAILNLTPAHAQGADQKSAAAPAAVAQPTIPPEQFGAWLYYIASELRAIRADMVQVRLEGQESRIEQIEREVQKVRQKQSVLQMEESQQQQQISEANALSEQQLDAEQRAQVEAIRKELAGDTANRLRTERTEAATAESQLLQRLQREKALYAQLQALSKQISGAAAQ